MIKTNSVRAPLFKYVLLILLPLGLVACEKVLNLKLDKVELIGVENFRAAAGFKLPYDLYAPSAMMGWELSNSTRLTFDETKQLYWLDSILIDKPLLDENGARFKICSDGWQYQFGFGKYVANAESTFGVSAEGIVVRVEQFEEAANDLRVEFPAPILNADAKIIATNALAVTRVMRVEFKVTQLEPVPAGMVYVVIHDLHVDQ